MGPGTVKTQAKADQPMGRPGTSTSCSGYSSDIPFLGQPVVSGFLPAVGQVVQVEFPPFPEQPAHIGQVIRIVGQFLQYHPVIPDGGEMPVGIVDVAIWQTVMQGWPALDSWILDVAFQAIPV